MSATRFKLDLPDFELEISGDQGFVEDLYRQVSQDIIPLVMPGPDGAESTLVTELARSDAGYTWVYGITDYYSKVYAVDNDTLERGLLGRHLRPSLIRRIYVARDDNDLFANLAGNQNTLWAEFTPAGRDRFQRTGGGDELPPTLVQGPPKKP